jgi:excisionase family DNA binding protein
MANKNNTTQQKRLRKVQEKPESVLLTVREVARIFRVDDTTVRRWIKTGAMDAVLLPHANVRQGYRVRKETIEALTK